MILAHYSWFFIKITLSKTSPLMHNSEFDASAASSYKFLVLITVTSLISFQTKTPSEGLFIAKRDLPFPKLSSYPIKAAVRALSPVIILT